MAETTDSIIVEQSFYVSKVRLWQAITEHDQMVQWFFEEIPDFKAEPGFETQFNISTGERDFNHLWKITTAVPGEKIVYDWRYEGYDGAGIVTFELFDEGGGSRLRLKAEGTETFPQEIPEFKRESGVAGWEYFIQGNLKQFLEPGI